jgi:two-component system, chemotaxis family, CheB/CheR fusion protein
MTAEEREVRDSAGAWYLLRIRPYKDTDNRIDGAVVVLLDIDAMRRQEDQLREAKALAEAVVDAMRDPLIVLETDLRIRSVNETFCRVFDMDRRQAIGRPLPELAQGRWDIPYLRTMLDRLTSEKSPPVEAFEVDHDFPGVGRKRLLINARRGPASVDSGRPFILMAIEEKAIS